MTRQRSTRIGILRESGSALMELRDERSLINLLLNCQKVSYQLMEDLSRLQVHPLVTNANDPTESFMALVNRRELVKGDPTPEADGIPRSDLILHFRLGHDADHKSTMEEAKRILNIYESYTVPASATRLPPPIWLRLLPACLEVTQVLGLWGADKPTKLRFMSFAMEPVKKWEKAYETFVNINSNVPRLHIREHPLSNGRFSKSLNRALFGSFYDDRLEDIGRLTSCVWWGIRFRTSVSNEAPREPNWLDVWVDPNQSGKKYRAKVRFPEQISDNARTGLERLFRDWAFDDIPADQRATIPLDTPSEQVSAYVTVNQEALPYGQLPESGMDCLICPGVFWSADAFHWGTGMTTVYGFEGYLEEEVSNLLLSITQQLMIAPTIYSQVIKLKDSSERAGRYNVLHNLPKDIQAIITNINRYNERRERFLLKYADAGISPSDIPPIPSPDALGVTLMFLAAEDPHQRRLNQLPLDLAMGLSTPWSEAFLNSFVERVVWDSVWGRVITDEKVKKALNSGALSRDELMRGEGAYQRPELKMPTSIHVKHADELYPLLLVTLRSAYQHAYLHSVLSPPGSGRGVVAITYEEADGKEYIHIKNSGAPHHNRQFSQQGWLRDVAVFKGLTNNWSVELKDEVRRHYSVWRGGQWHGFAGHWETTLARS
jgi:hypothetical protein